MSNTVLYALWGVLYALCAGLGFVTEPENSMRILMTALAVAHFAAPFALSYRAGKKQDVRTLKLVRNLSGCWLVLAAVLLAGNFLSVLASERVGNLMHILLTIVASPMVASGNWALTIFLWACVFFDARSKLKK